MNMFFRSATYNPISGDCRTSDMDRHTVSGTGGVFIESIDDEYLENNCADDPVKLCDFQLLENKIMKTVDSVYQVHSLLVFYMGGIRWSKFCYLHHNLQSLNNHICILDTTLRT